MDRLYKHYKSWEDYKNGMYHSSCDQAILIKNLCKELLGNQTEFGNAARAMIADWVNSCDVFLSNSSINRLAWIGQATCCREFGAPDFVTIMAWNEMGKNDQDLANGIARIVLNEWVNMKESNDAKTLFDV